MSEIVLKTDKPVEASEILAEALATEALRIKYGMSLAQKRLRHFEKKYKVTSADFLSKMAAEDLIGGDMEYVEWAGEFRLAQRLSERLQALKSIDHESGHGS